MFSRVAILAALFLAAECAERSSFFHFFKTSIWWCYYFFLLTICLSHSFLVRNGISSYVTFNLIANDVEYLPCDYSSSVYFFSAVSMIFCPLSNWVFIFYHGILRVLYNSRTDLFNMWFVNIFPSSVACLFFF